MKTIALVANYAAGKNQLSLLAEKISKLGHRVQTCLTVNEKLADSGFREAVHGADLLVVGMAPDPISALVEFGAMDLAKELEIPVILYADTFGVALRPSLKERRGAVAGLFVPSESEALRAKPLFPHAEIYPFGNPEWWVSRFPSMSKEDARALLGVKEGEVVILYSGTKRELADLHIVGQLVNACLAENMHARIIYTFHPGTRIFGEGKADEPAVRMVLNRIVRPLQEGNDWVTAVVAEKGVSTEVVQCAADLVAESLSATGVIAIIRRQPVISFMTEMMKKHIGYVQGDSWYPLTAEGASAKASDNAVLLGKMIRNLLGNGEIRRHQLEAQERFLKLDRDPRDAMAEILLRD